MSDNELRKLAVLIDADNAQPSICADLLAEVAKFGTASVKRAYGDWTTTNLKSWKPLLNKHAIQPVQQFSYTKGKNSTDASLIIDAMDLLHEGNMGGFCLVSSDSDFTRLATRIRESGVPVLGFGEEKTPEPFVSACDKFVYTEILRKNHVQEKKNLVNRDIIEHAVEAVSKEDGWAPLAGVGGYINKNHPSFDPRNFGFTKLSKLIKSLSYIEIKLEQFNDGSSNSHIYVRTID